MTGHQAEQAPATAAGALPPALPSDIAVAARVAQLLLAEHKDVDHRDLFALNRAHGALTESLRILLRALGAEPSQPPARRCPAAHPDDPTPCVGPVVVTVLDATNAGAKGCEHHGARLLASLTGGRVYPLPDAPDDAAIRVFKEADGTHPYPWADGPRTRPAQLSHAENRARGERR
ncbi:hypothetical protein [Streptomyces sp. NPDC057838]|uniref:hypothetical protein n=1 Tax=unclassified Streptomyces TaxID=2593676 RepID=UPI0036816177